MRRGTKKQQASCRYDVESYLDHVCSRLFAFRDMAGHPGDDDFALYEEHGDRSEKAGLVDEHLRHCRQCNALFFDSYVAEEEMREEPR